MLLSNRYEVIREKELGEGGFGKTYLAIDTQLPSKPQCVVKELKPQTEIDFEEVLKRFEQEAAILDKLGQQHPQIPKLFAYFADSGKFYLVQEFVEGQTLASRIQAQGALSEMEVYRLLCQTLPILSYIHTEGVIHRDIKPDNIILRASDNMPVLIDFGAVKETLGQLGVTALPPTISIGTLGFMSSEQAAGRPIFSSDIFSLGVTAIYALTQKGPLSHTTNPKNGLMEWHNPGTPLNISPQFAAVLDRAIHPSIEQRYTNADEMLSDLMAMNQTQPGHGAQPASPGQTIPETTLAASAPTPPVPTPSVPASSSASALEETTYSPTPPEGTGSSSAPSERATIAPGNIPFGGRSASASAIPEEPKPSKFPWVPVGAIGIPVTLIVAAIALFAASENFSGSDNCTTVTTTAGNETNTTVVCDGDEPNTPNSIKTVNNPPITPVEPITKAPLEEPTNPSATIDCSRADDSGDYCDFTLDPGFLPDPVIGTGLSGGPNFTEDCGYVDDEPDHIVTLTQEIPYLLSYVEAAGDVTLLITGPDGRFCNDDTEGLLPEISGYWPQGTYQIWVGDWDNEGLPYSLFLTEVE